MAWGTTERGYIRRHLWTVFATTLAGILASGCSGGDVSSCVRDGIRYEDGTTGIPSADGCSSCSCLDGMLHCEPTDCGEPRTCGGDLPNGVCEADEYCAYQGEGECGFADATSVCKPRPEACDDVYQPVCGCDGKTYGNACEAAAAGWGYLHAGECDGGGEPGGECEVGGTTYPDGTSGIPAPDGCNTCTCTDGQLACTEIACPEPTRCGGEVGVPFCPEDEYCAYEGAGECGALDESAFCKPRPENCLTIYDPVCGCDGQTYSNDCFAAMAGIGYGSRGACDDDGDRGGSCELDGIVYPDGTNGIPADDGCNTCSCEDGELLCTLRVCPEPTICGGFAGDTCSDDEYCAYTGNSTYCGAADASSICRPRPTVCDRRYEPVCGCDNRTYANSCTAAAAGQGYLHLGPCE